MLGDKRRLAMLATSWSESRFIISSIWIGTEQLVTNRTEISGNDLCCETGRMPDWQDARILMPAFNQVALCVT